MSSSPSSSSTSYAPIWAVQLALQAILVSIQQFTEAHLKWAAIASNTIGGIPSFGIDETNHSAIQPTRARIEALRIPVQGEAWDEYKDVLSKTAEAVKGLRAFKTSVVKENEHLDKLVASSSPSAPCPNSSNGPFLCQLWQQVLRVALTQGPVMEINASLPIPVEGTHPSTSSSSSPRGRHRKQLGGGKNKLAKVDVIAEGGKSWTRVFTIKQSSLLAEFREADSYMGASGDSSDEDDDVERYAELTGSGIDEGRARRLGEASSLFAELDQATANCSVVRSLEELLACRAASKYHDAITLHLVFSRINLPPADQSHSCRLSIDFLKSVSEEERYLRRLQSISNLISRLKQVTVKNDDGLLKAPSEKILPSSLASGSHSYPLPSDVALFDTALLALPAVPMPPSEKDLPVVPTTPIINLDVSALVALVSDIAHMPIPPKGFDLESLFRPMGIRSMEAQPVEDEELMQCQKDAKAKFLHGRALAMQLALEQKGSSFLGYVIDVSRSAKTPLRFCTTTEARDKFCDIMDLVAGPDEQRRGRALLDSEGLGNETMDSFWKGSRWEGNLDARAAFFLPVEIVSFEPSPSEVRELPPFTARCRQVILNGLTDLADKKASSAVSANPRQTAHTLNTLLMGIDREMTTLTTNMLSVKWLIKEVAKGMSESHMKGESVRNGDFKSVLILVTNPRSLAERMKVEKPKATDEPSAFRGSGQDTITPINACSPALPSNDHSYSSSGSSKAIDTKLSSSEGEDYLQISLPRVFAPRSDIRDFNDRDTGNISEEASPVSPSRLRRLLRWTAGPRPPTQLRIRHYPWWPLQGLEERWLKLTRPIAWQDPDGNQDAFRREVNLGNPGVTWPRRPAWLARGRSQAIDLEDLSSDRQPSEPLQLASSSSDSPPAHPATLWKLGFLKEWRTNRIHWLLLFITCVGWLAGFIALANDAWYNASISGAATGESSSPSFYSCTSTYWLANTGCGLNGEDCEPFFYNTSIAFRCPASCAGTTLGAARAVGSELPNWVPLVVGGGDERGMYRGDSWVCAAAVHAGIISNDAGGCGQMWVAGTYSGYNGSTANGLTSESFDSSFPVSYFFEEQTSSSHCTDTRDRIYILDSVLSAFVGLVLQPASLVWYFMLVTVGFWHVNFASEPRAFPPTVGGPAGDYLPLLFVCYAFYRLTFRFLLPAFDRLPIERTIGALGLFWIGTMMGVVFADVPLQRLVLSDITSQPGALVSLIVVILVVIVVAINQIRVIRKTGYLPKYLTLAIVGLAIVGLLAAVPTTGLRLHHYIIAMCLLPFLAFETRISLLAAFFLLGMLVNGIGRWSFDGIIQDVSVITGDAPSGSALPSFLPASNWTGVQNGVGLVNWISLQDASPPGSEYGYTGFSLMVDDVLRLSGTSTTSFNLATLLTDFSVDSPVNNFTFYPGGSATDNIDQTIANQPHYLRLAYTRNGDAADFTRAAVAYFNGTWIDPPPGAT